VQEDEHAVGVGEVALVLLHARAGQRAAELGEQRPAEQLGHGQVGDIGKRRLDLFLALGRCADAHAQHVDQRAAGIADVVQDLLQPALARVLHDHAGAGRDVGLVVGVLAFEVGGGDVDAGVAEPAGERGTVDEKLDLEAGQQDLVENLDEQLVLADGKTPHRCAGTCVCLANAATIAGNTNYSSASG
jgi:hypothetical protein